MHIEALRDYCLSLPHTTEDFPFDNRTLVFRVGGKMYLLTDVEDNHSFNAKCAPEKAIELRERFPKAILPGYHMNKVHWNTVRTDKGLDQRLLTELIRHSYDLIYQSLPKKIRESLVNS